MPRACVFASVEGVPEMFDAAWEIRFPYVIYFEVDDKRMRMESDCWRYVPTKGIAMAIRG
jgi:hypothetical protein